MDFFERQDKARRQTGLLIFYFSAAVCFLIFAIYGVVLAVFGYADARSGGQARLWAPDLFFYSAIGTLAVITIGSVSKMLELSGGGSSVAEMLDGRLVNPNSADWNERKLLNIVEEMAIASGVPVPAVYVMDREEGINAFAAGYSTGDAVISVTNGALQLLNRDELQGVIAHEFSHILNGDMRLNVRLIGIIFGILCLTVVGRILIRTRGKKNPLPFIGIALIIIGWAGVFFGRLIQAAVSRQREHLADASAVQFTRNPLGLANALKKIGSLGEGSRIESEHAEEASHLFFASGVRHSFAGLMDTHPNLFDRIRLLDPGFDGNYPSIKKVLDAAHAEEPAPGPRRDAFPEIPGMPQGIPSILGPAVIAAESVLPEAGQTSPQHLHYAINLKSVLIPPLEADARDPLGATCILYALLLSNDPAIQEQQLAQLARVTTEAAREETVRILPAVRALPKEAKIPLIDFSLPALRRLSANQFLQFRSALKALLEADHQVDLFEYMLQKIVLRHLEPSFLPSERRETRFWALQPLTEDCGMLLSTLAYAGQNNAEQARVAFDRGAGLLQSLTKEPIPFFSPDACELTKFDLALQKIDTALPPLKKTVLNACVETVATDNVVTESEAELLRAVADVFDCPIPPFLRTADAQAPT